MGPMVGPMGATGMGTMAGEEVDWSVVLRVAFTKDSFVKIGNHSTVFGFTTDLPPVEAPLRIEDSVDAARGDGVAPVGFAPGVAPAVGEGVSAGTGIGMAASPAGAPAAATTVAGGGGLLGGLIGGGSSFPGAPGIAGGIGAARAPAGAFGSGTGSGQGNTQGTGTAGQTGQVNINFNAVLTNQQQQQQAQAQKQSQSQNQRQNQVNVPREVIPEPGAIILGLLGLPGLYFFCRRRKATEPAAA